MHDGWERRATGLFVPVGGHRSPAAVQVPPAERFDPAYVAGAIPLLMPLLGVLMIGDVAVLRVLLSQGHLVELFLAQMWPFLPTLIGSALYLTGTRLASPTNRRIVVISTVLAGALLLPLVPLAFAAAQLVILALVVLAARSRQPMWLVPLGIGIALLAIGAVAQVPGVTDVARSRALYGLPREVAVKADGTVWIYYLVAVDDHTITAITANPVAVGNFRVEDTPVRLACQHHSRGLSRSLVSVIRPYRGGTAWCGDLADCLSALPEPNDRSSNEAINRCMKAAGVARPTY